MKHRTITCDACGVTKDDPHDVEAFGWFTVSRTGYYVGEPPPRDTAPPRPPDLCSWECVAVYAQDRATAAKRNGVGSASRS